MDRNSLIFLILTALVGVLSASPSSAKVLLEEHNSAKECAICHYRWLDVFFFEGKGTDLVDYQKERVAGKEEMCFSCHNGSVTDSRRKVWKFGGHKVKIKPSEAIHVTKILPLDAEGQVVCATCHTAHGVADETRFDQVIYVRLPNPNSELCKICHTGEFEWKKGGGHPIDVTTLPFPKELTAAGAKPGTKPNQVICESCHMAHGGTNEKLLALEMENGIQDESFLCEACHTKSPKLKASPGGTFTHPVNVVPQTAKIPSNWDKDTKTITSKDRRIVCRTCHVTHKGVPGEALLPRSTKESVICIACHQDKKEILTGRHNMAQVAPKEVNGVGKTAADTGPCSACHLVHSGFNAFMLAQQQVPTESNPVSGMCFACHKPDRVGKKKVIHDQAHPLLLDPEKTSIRTGFPLFDHEGKMLNPKGEVLFGGKITCATCHDVHFKDANPEGKPKIGEMPPGVNPYFLRKVGVELCIDCHRDKIQSAPGSFRN